MTYRDRFNEAHRAKHYEQYTSGGEYPHRYFKPTMPKIATANGLTDFICKFLNWSGHHANRINVQGRKIGNKWIRSTTRKGTADIHAIINGRSVSIEIKVGRDKPSDAQLSEQQAIRSAGGIYEFVHTPEEFFELYDRLMNF
jgi:hypothetical protein